MVEPGLRLHRAVVELKKLEDEGHISGFEIHGVSVVVPCEDKEQPLHDPEYYEADGLHIPYPTPGRKAAVEPHAEVVRREIGETYVHDEEPKGVKCYECGAENPPSAKRCWKCKVEVE